jgi:hypothetical protein
MSVAKQLRLIPRWFFIVVGILAAPFALWLGVGLYDTAQSLNWHRAHGNKVVFQGHTITLPLMWRQDPSGSGAVLKLSRSSIWPPILPLLNGPESLAIGSGANGPELYDDATALKWQTKMVASYNSSRYFAVPENLRSRAMTFYCFDRDDGDIHDGCILCEATGTNWDLNFAAGQTDPAAVQRQMQEAREILQSIE